MRKQLEKLYGKRMRFSGTFVRKGKARAYKGWGSLGDGFDETFLLSGVKDHAGRLLTDHLWFKMTGSFRRAAMSEGQTVSFDGRVDDYVMGYYRTDYDYKLSRPTMVVNHGCPVRSDLVPGAPGKDEQAHEIVAVVPERQAHGVATPTMKGCGSY